MHRRARARRMALVLSARDRAALVKRVVDAVLAELGAPRDWRRRMLAHGHAVLRRLLLVAATGDPPALIANCNYI